MKKLAPIFVLSAGILWGMMGMYVRRLDEQHFTTIDIVTVRSVMTALFMEVVLLCYKRSLLKVKIRDLWCFAGTGICSIVFFNYCYFKAITLTSLSVAAVLLYTAPAIVMVLSAFLFKEKITMAKMVSLLATFIGCVCVTGLVGDVETLTVQGILTGLGAGLGYALYSIFGRLAIQRGYHSLTITFYTFLFASFATLPLADTDKIVATCVRDGSMLGFYIVFALVSTVIPYVLYTLGLTAMENSKAAIVASVEPVAATVFGIVLFEEKMTVNNLAGIVLVLGAIIICNINWKKRSRE